MKINNFRGDLSSISAKMATLMATELYKLRFRASPPRRRKYNSMLNSANLIRSELMYMLVHASHRELYVRLDRSTQKAYDTIDRSTLYRKFWNLDGLVAKPTTTALWIHNLSGLWNHICLQPRHTQIAVPTWNATTQHNMYPRRETYIYSYQVAILEAHRWGKTGWALMVHIRKPWSFFQN